jgi:hypothetical protein
MHASADKLPGAASSPAATAKDGEELDQVAGNAEDEIGDRIAGVRETELLYGEESLLAVYGPMIVHICGSPHKFKVGLSTKSGAVVYLPRRIAHFVLLQPCPSASSFASVHSFATSTIAYYSRFSRLPKTQISEVISLSPSEMLLCRSAISSTRIAMSSTKVSPTRIWWLKRILSWF